MSHEDLIAETRERMASRAEAAGLPMDHPAARPERGMEFDIDARVARIAQSCADERLAIARDRATSAQARAVTLKAMSQARLAVWMIGAIVVAGIAFGCYVMTQQATLARENRAAIEGVQDVQTVTRRNSLTGCQRSNVQNTALLDLGKIITSARAQTSTSPAVRRAAVDFIAQVKRLDPREPTTKALHDIAVLLGGYSGTPSDARELARLEYDFIAKSKTIERPRRCKALYGKKSVVQAGSLKALRMP